MSTEEIKASILLVEDDENLGFVIKDYLEMSGYEVRWEQDGKRGFDAFRENQMSIDLCILDIMMPVKDGFTLAQEIRSITNDTPIIFLSAKTLQEDRIKGLRIGADDYITKPFSTEEFLLRIEAVLRRYNKNTGDKVQMYEFGKFQFDYYNQILRIDGEERHLTKRESDVLRILCEHKNQLVRREVVLKSIWGEDDYFMGRSMDVYITKLRKYLKDDENIGIVNIHGTGFKLEVR